MKLKISEIEKSKEPEEKKKRIMADIRSNYERKIKERNEQNHDVESQT